MKLRNRNLKAAPLPKPIHRPWRDRVPRPARPDTVVIGGTPLMEVRIYETTVLVTRRTAHGGWRSYPVKPEALAQTLARVPASSGLLPAGTLAAGTIAGAPFLVTYVPPAVRSVQTSQRMYRIPTPPLVIGGCGRDWRVFALATEAYPADMALPLFVAPFPNCYRDGRICWGDVAGVPEASGKTVGTVRRLFLEESAFNGHVANGKSVAYPVSVLAQWDALEAAGAEAYPLDDMIPAECQLSWLIGGGPWSH